MERGQRGVEDAWRLYTPGSKGGGGARLLLLLPLANPEQHSKVCMYTPVARSGSWPRRLLVIGLRLLLQLAHALRFLVVATPDNCRHANPTCRPAIHNQPTTGAMACAQHA